MLKKIILSALLILLANPCLADEYYLNQWVWVDDGELSHFTAPHVEYRTGNIDLRSETEAAVPVIPNGYAIFAYSQRVPSGIYLGNDLDAELSNQQLNALKQALKLAPLRSTTLREIIYEALTEHADPTGKVSFKPLLPGRDMKMKIYLGTAGKIKETSLVPFVSKEWDLVLQTMQEDYRRMLTTEPWHEIAKQLDYWEDKFGVHYSTFIPDDALQLASLPHATTITDDFDCANSASPDCDLSYTELSTGDFKIDSNELEIAKFCCHNSHNTVRADTDLSGDDHYAQIQATSGNSITAQSVPNWYGTFVRKDSSATMTFYQGRYRHRSDANTDTYHIYEWTAGTDTDIQNDTTGATTPSYPFTIKTEVDGSTIKFYVNGTEELSVTDTSITGNTRTGFWGYKQHASNRVNLDNFEAADLGAVVTPKPQRAIGLSIGRGIL